MSALLSGQAKQDSAVDRQLQSIQRQRDALQSQNGSLGKQQAAAAKQVVSAAKQPRAVWESPPATGGPSMASLECAPLPASIVDPIVAKAAQSNALTSDLLRAVISRESAFKPCAVSPAGALGLMQLMPQTASALGVDNAFDPEQNISAGSQFLRMMLDRFGGNLSLALGAYNAGPGRVDAAGGIPAIPETQNYVNQIMQRLK